MDNRNDFQWRPEDWEHTLGHLRKAERLLWLKTWGVGTALVGTVVTSTVLYLQPGVEDSNTSTKVTHRIEAIETVQPDAPAPLAPLAPPVPPTAPAAPVAHEVKIATSTVNATADAASAVANWEEAIEAIEARDEPQRGSSEISEDIQAIPAAAIPSPIDQLQAANRADSPSNTTGPSRDVRQVDVEIEGAMTLLERLGPSHLAHSEIPLFSHVQKEGLNNRVVADRKSPPLRLSALPVQKGIALERPITVGRIGGGRMEMTPGVSIATASVQWAAWHPGEIFGAPSEWRQVHSDLAIRSQAILSGMMALSPVLEVGVSAGVQCELTRRMEHGIWNPDANAWDEVFESNVWGRVDEANPWSAIAGLRLDYAVAPEWKVVAQVGRTMASDLARKQPAIDVSKSTPLWIQIGIQR